MMKKKRKNCFWFKKKNIVTLIKFSEIEIHKSPLSSPSVKKNQRLKGSISLRPYTQIDTDMLRKLFQTSSPGGASELKLAVKANWSCY